MNLAVKFYGSIPVEKKPIGIPDAWPVEVLELGERTDVPDNDWQLMTKEEFESYTSAHQREYDDWIIARKNSPDSLQLHKDKTNQQLDQETREFITSKYPLETHIILHSMRDDARADRKTNRFNYIQQLVDWVNSILSYQYSISDQIQSGTTISEVDNIIWSHVENAPVNPNISIRTARGILD